MDKKDTKNPQPPKSGFLTPLVAEKVRGTEDTWIIREPLVYYRTEIRDGQEVIQQIIIPDGFVTDYASTPRFVWLLMPKSGKYDDAAVVHDYLYVHAGKLNNRDLPYTKADADAIFKEAMKALGVDWLRISLMYPAVRIFGKGSF